MKACVTFAVIVALLGDFKFLLDVIETTLTLFPTHKGVAVLLNPNWALTTKVAVTPGFGKAVHLEYGKSKGGVGRSVDISQTVVHSDGVLTLVKLKKAIAYDTLTKPVNLPFSGVDNSDMMALLAGWTTDDKELRSAAVRVLSTDECKAKGVAVDTQLCTADAQVATCNTDDGSPLVQDMKNGVYKLVGIATETKGVKCPPAAGDVRKYYDVSKYIDWIFSNAFA